MDGLELASLVVAARQFKAVQYMHVATMTLLVTDYVINFEREVSLVWKARRGLSGVGTVLYLIARCMSFIAAPFILYFYLTPNPQHCRLSWNIASWSMVFATIMSEMILLLRTYALWSCNRWLLYGLLAAISAMCTATLTIIALFNKSLEYGRSPLLPFATGCHITKYSRIFPYEFAAILFFESVIVCLTVLRGFQTFRRSSRSTPLYTVLYRDGILFYLCAFAASISNIVVVGSMSNQLMPLLVSFQPSMHVIMATRIILHLRQAGKDEVVNPSNQYELQTLAFAVLSMQPGADADSSSEVEEDDA